MDIKYNNDFLEICKSAFGLTIKGYSPSYIVVRESCNPLSTNDTEEIQKLSDFQAETPYPIFEKLEQSIKTINEGKIYEQIEKLHKPHRCILLNGENDDLIKGVACYLYNNKYNLGSFRYKNYSGYTDENIIHDLFSDNEPVFNTPLFYLYLKLGGTLFLRGLENLSMDSLKYITGLLEDHVGGRSEYRGMFIVGIDNIASLPEYFRMQFEEINLEPEKQSRIENITQGETESKNSNVKTETVFFDDKTNYLWFSEDKKTRIEGEDAKLVKAMLDMTERENRHCCRKEEIILKAYEITVGINQKIPHKITNKLNTSKSTINKKCKLDLNIKELIQRDGVKLLKFSINVEKRKL